MEYQCDAICLKNGVRLVGLEDLIFSAIVAYPKQEVYAEILRDGSRYSFRPLDAPPSLAQQPQPPTGASRVGHLLSRLLRNSFDYDFQQRLQPSISDLRSMYELGDTLRAFIVTNGIGWAFRLFDFHNVSLAEFNWLEFGFVKATQNKETVAAFLNCIPKRMALGLLQSNQQMTEFLVDELMTIVTRVEGLQNCYGAATPTERINELLAVTPSALVIGETFQQKDKLQPNEIFEQHLVEAFNAVKRGDNKSAFSEVLKFALPTVSVLTQIENGANKLGIITDMNTRLLQLRLPDVPESKRLKTLIEFLRETLEHGYRFLKEGHDKRKACPEQDRRPEEKVDCSIIPCSQSQIGVVGELKFLGIEKFMFEARRSYPNRVIGQIVHLCNQANQYAITNIRVVPCDVAISISSGTSIRKGFAEGCDAGDPTVLVGKSVSKVCCCEHEVLTLLHSNTYTLNEMLRSGYTFNAIAVTNGEKCLLRLHDGSNNTVLAVCLPSQTASR